MYLLTFDLGNSSAKSALHQFKNNSFNLVDSFSLPELSIKLKEYNLHWGDVVGVISAVKHYPEMDDFLKNGLWTHEPKKEFKGKKFFGMPVEYSETIGADRLIGAYGVFHKEIKPTLLIDAGTFLTIDLITDQGLIGGYILPGLNLITKDYEEGAMLSEVKWAPLTEEIPKNTFNALQSYAYVLIEFILTLKSKHQVDHLVLTGGDALTVKNWMEKKHHPLSLNPHHLHQSMAKWYQRNHLI
jgi:pantothenate kinase type III